MRYTLFCGDDYYSKGGIGDFQGMFDDISAAIKFASKHWKVEGYTHVYNFEWWHVFDTKKGALVEKGNIKCNSDLLDSYRYSGIPAPIEDR